ncbi:hypothetical protein LCGC14_0829840 [marine sediment metagenome]|uniref:Peptide deformylase n=1 Tax=marine sediment metagenome TaxID=412755 RepID=A0A0F9PL30_9ZZZZ
MTRLKGRARANASKKRRSKVRYDGVIYRKKMISKIRKYDDLILEAECDWVDNEEDVSFIIKELKKVLMATKKGIGISASQIGYTKRIIAIRPGGWGGKISILINPEIAEQSEEKIKGTEGCLSYPGVQATVERFKDIKLKYKNEDNILKVEKFKELESIIIQHEIDHLLEGWCKVYYAWKEQQKETKDGKDGD